MTAGNAALDLRRLAGLVARLRGPDGCPWDREQTLESARAYLLEEAHEVAAAIDGGDWNALAGELGDLLFQWVFVASLAEEAGAFRLPQVLDAVAAKMVARHPHVFGGERLTDADAVRQAWERRKVGEGDAGGSLLDGLPASTPALLAAYRMTQKAAGVGFDWPDAAAVLARVEEELGELRSELGGRGNGADREAVEHEVGDLLFSIANLARHLGLDPEGALSRANRRFRQRFRHIERRLEATGRTVREASLAEMDALWEEAKGGSR